jgi:hypothetical protein
MPSSVQKDGRGLPSRQGGMDHRFHYARWDGAAWRVHEVAFAGTRLYSYEDDYTGLAALDPNNPDVLYISTDADPVTGAPLVSKADGMRHRRFYCGVTRDSGATWKWEPLTANWTLTTCARSCRSGRIREPLVWMRGTYKHNRGEWNTKVVALILPANNP